jgi:hypothetical protein
MSRRSGMPPGVLRWAAYNDCWEEGREEVGWRTLDVTPSSRIVPGNVCGGRLERRLGTSGLQVY